MAVYIDPWVAVTPATKNNTWQDVDVSSFVPEGATGVLVWLYVNHASTSYTAGVRKKGSTDDIKDLLGAATSITVAIGLDENRVFQVYSANATNVLVYVLAYFTSDAVFFTNAVAVPVSAAWTARDLSGSIPEGAVWAFFIMKVPAAFRLGVRPTGSTDLDYPSYTFINGRMSGVNAARSVDTYGSSAGSTYLYLVGYSTGGSFKTTAPNVAMSVPLTWETKDRSADAFAHVGGLVVLLIWSDYGRYGSARKQSGGTGPLCYQRGGEHRVVGLTDLKTFDAYISHTTEGKVRLLGYFDAVEEQPSVFPERGLTGVGDSLNLGRVPIIG